MSKMYFRILILVLFGANAFGQSLSFPIAKEVEQQRAALDAISPVDLLHKRGTDISGYPKIQEEVREAVLYELDKSELRQLRNKKPQYLKIRLEDTNGESFLLELFKAEFLSENFKLRLASQPDKAVEFQPGLHYRGIVNGETRSLAMLYLSPDEVGGVVEFRGQQYNLGKVKGETGLHIFYATDAMISPPAYDCHTEAQEINRPDKPQEGGARSPNPNNCLKIYVEVDYDIFVDQGGVLPAANYAAFLFSQVSTLYANESINLVATEFFVWDVEDPYVGGNNGAFDYMLQFEVALGGDFNGADLAHLLGYQGYGGIATVNVLCWDSESRTAYSGINSVAYQVPTYSWSVNVVTHEIGHNIGTRHTHDCVWNGDNTPIDNCGPLAGYPGIVPGSSGEECPDNSVTPTAGTIMSYCHLVGGVGISFVEGFGLQPGDLIRNKVYNASCLTPCSAFSTTDAGITSVEMPKGVVCGNSVSPVVSLYNYGSDTLTSVSISYSLDGTPAQNYTWTGSLGSNQEEEVTLPEVNFSNGSHTFTVSTSSPNGGADDEPANDNAISSFSTGDNTLTLSITLDDYPAETTWTVTDNSNTVLVSGGSYSGQQNTTVNEQICLTDGCFSLNIFDSSGDGICCYYGNGSYTLTDNSTNTVLASGGSFNSQETTGFCLPVPSPCTAPTNLQAINLTTNTALLSWSAVAGASEYELQYLQQGMPMNSIVTLYISDNSEQLTGLNPNTTYLWRVKALCSNEDSPYSSIGNFMTTDDTCPDSDNDEVCDDDDQCPGIDDALIGTPCDDGDNCTENDIYGVDCSCAGTLIDVNNNNICDLDEVDDCATPTNLQAVNITNTSATLSWGSVPGADEYMLQYLQQGMPMSNIATIYTNSSSEFITGLTESSTYLWRVRAICSDENSPFSSVEDFTTADNSCPDSDNDGICDSDDQCPGQDDNLIGMSCDDGDDCTENDYYNANCTCAGTLIDSNTNGICDLQEGCTNPTGLTAIANSNTSATFQWDPVPNATAYRLQYRPIGYSPTSMDISATSYTDNSLPAGSTVQWRVKAICADENSNFTNGNSVSLGSGLTMGAPTWNGLEEAIQFSLFPNPARDKVTLAWNDQITGGTVVVRNMMGQTVGTYLVAESDQLTLNTAEWGNNQVLVVTVHQEGTQPVSKKLVISR
ncbi:fibronectin type III domain-containing protein [Phaeodactylibacter xiamenensis]|uniref:fibronectin type III domain-containing protein n=1 Tax=Phaeodactylibacter xiamenensis TaxID=1524460 RepID=UPI0024A7DDF8|nr:fibronectin type III domain-containing protein [Phaeodactylibacter xiamenensis]